MTGFGRGVAEVGGVRAAVDIRSVNHRFLDLKLRGVVGPALEDAVSARVRSAVERGSVTVQIHVARPTAVGLHIYRVAAVAAHAELVALAIQLRAHGPDLALVLAQPGVVVTADAELDGDELLPVVLAALDAALGALAAMRDLEGAALARDLTVRFGELEVARSRLAAIAAELPDQLRRRLDDRIRKLLADTTVDPARLAQEAALLADRADVTEELVRLASHLAQANTLVAASGPVGRKLDFLIQEIGRELNTVGSKSAAAELTAIVVDAKAGLEKIREQVQNVE